MDLTNPFECKFVNQTLTNQIKSRYDYGFLYLRYSKNPWNLIGIRLIMGNLIAGAQIIHIIIAVYSQ